MATAAPDAGADHLVNVITASAMDYLIVLGDRNMRNETCQSRGNGRLMEVPVAERVRTLLRDWADVTGLAISKRSSGRGHVQDSQEVAALSEPELWDTFRRYTGSRLGYDRVSKLRDVRCWPQPERRPAVQRSPREGAASRPLTHPLRRHAAP